MILLLQELTREIFPLCEDYVLVSQFVESRSHFKNGLVNLALAVALRAFLLVQPLSVEKKLNSASMLS
jgi:gamma-tubulin complex component 2